MSTREAKADFAEDAKDIIEQLIEDDISTHVVPNAAGKFPVMCDLFPASVYAIKARRYNGFPAVVRKELADAAGLIVIAAIQKDRLALETAPGLHQQTLDVLKTFVTDLTAKKIVADDVLCSFAAEKNQGATSGLGSAAAAQSVATQVLHACASTQDSAVPEIACSVGTAMRDAADGGDRLLAGDARRILVAIAAAAALTPLEPVHAATVVTPLVPVPAGSAVIPLAALQVDPPKDAARFGQAISLINQALENKMANLDVGDSGLDAKTIQILANEVSTIASTSSATIEQLLGTVAAFGKRLKAIRVKDGILDKVNFDVIGNIGDGTYSVVKEIQAKNYGAAAAAAFDVVDAVIDNACGQYDEENTNSKKKDLSAKERAEKEVCDGATNALVRDFIKASAVYAIDSTTVGNPNSPNSSNFRVAAVRLIENASGAGIRRRTFEAHVPGVLFPAFALRGAVQPGHIGTNPGALMFYPSIDWPNLRLRPNYTSRLYWGFDFSVFDALGPFMEIATRNATLKNDVSTAKVFGLGFVVPRMEFEFGVPELTKNLVVGVGGAFRFYRADQTTQTSNPKYCWLGQSGCSGVDAYNLEGSIFVKYVP